MGEAWDAVQVGWQEQREALVAGWQTVTDPVLDIVSGKIVERVPGGNLPVASDIIDGISGEIKNGLNDAIYNTFIPEVPYDSMQNWRDAMGADVNKAVATSFYENRDAQDHYLQQLQQDDPALYQQIKADGEVTLEEFRDIPAVQDAVNTYGGEIVNGFQTEMAFDKIFPKD
jgi:hypothetical protein